MEIHLDFVPGTEYKIFQRRDLFSFGIDSIILSGYFKPRGKVLDMGSGNGILPLRLVDNKNIDEIVGYEIQKEQFELAEKSIKYNKLKNIKIENDDIKNIKLKYKPASFDSVITNPPYFMIDAENKTKSKTISRHIDSIENWIRIASKFLVPQGRFFTINKPENLVEIIYFMRINNIEPKHICFIKSRLNEEPVLILISGIKNGNTFLRIDKDLILYDEIGNKTEDLERIYDLEW